MGMTDWSHEKVMEVEMGSSVQPPPAPGLAIRESIANMKQRDTGSYAPSAPPPPDAFDDSIPFAQPVVLVCPDHYMPPSAEPRRSSGGLLFNMTKLTLYHVLNAALGLVGFIVVMVGKSLGVALLPLCCFGLVVFRLTMLAVHRLTQMDVRLHNFIALEQERLPAVISDECDWISISRGVGASSRVSCSPRVLLPAFYFATIKFALAWLSALSAAATFAFPVTTLSVAAMRRTFLHSAIGGAGFVALTLFLFYLGTALMSFAASLSCAATRYFSSPDEPSPSHCARATHTQHVRNASYGTSICDDAIHI